MIEDVKQAIERSAATMWRDLLGAISLCIAFFGFLYLPGLLPAI
ncbi:hypothetical protein [Pseudoruegeria sp. SK021]|nr:hypothetical protein [Pseudoruegeria sp. SK021]